METKQTPIPLTILTGFLGAGKTTLLNRILRAEHGLRVAVLVNDFGSVNIDSQLVVGVEGETISLANGCICCTIRDDLLRTAIEVINRPERPEYLIIEASGVSDPWAIAETFQLPGLRSLVNLDGVITLVDAEYVREISASESGYSDLIIDQLSAADIVLLNKCDLVEAEQRAAVRDWVRQVVPRARLLETVHADASFELLLGVGRYRLELQPLMSAHSNHADHHTHHHEHEHGEHCDHEHEHGEHCDHEHDHSQAFSTWSYMSEQPMELKLLRPVIIQLPISIFRAKGVVYLAEAPDRRAILQAVGRRVSLILSEPWGDTPPRTQMVFISAPGGIDSDTLAAHFDACRVGAVTPEAVPEQSAWERTV